MQEKGVNWDKLGIDNARALRWLSAILARPHKIHALIEPCHDLCLSSLASSQATTLLFLHLSTPANANAYKSKKITVA